MKITNDRLICFSFFLLFSFGQSGCQTTTPSPPEEKSRAKQLEAVARDFFDTFAERNNFDKFCSFYRDDLVFEDVMLQLKLDSLWQLKKFYKWDAEGNNFQKLSPEQEHLSIETLVANDSVAVGTGRVNPFYYYGNLVDPEWGMNFTIWLYFDEDLKIKKQVDWFEYDAASLESVIKRVRENGLDKIPDWLDLSRD